MLHLLENSSPLNIGIKLILVHNEQDTKILEDNW